MKSISYCNGSPTYWDNHPFQAGAIRSVLAALGLAPLLSGLAWYFFSMYRTVAAQPYTFNLPPAWAPFAWLAISIVWAICLLPLAFNFNS